MTAAVYHFIKMRRDIRRSKTHKGVIGLIQGSLAGGKECARERERNYFVLIQEKLKLKHLRTRTALCINKGDLKFSFHQCNLMKLGII